jgi:hypothetical protein
MEMYEHPFLQRLRDLARGRKLITDLVAIGYGVELDMFAQRGFTALNHLLWATKMKHATDPRDKLFALLGFVPSVSLQAGYSKPVERVYKEFARAFVKESSTLSVLFLNRFPKSLDLLSWVPDLSLTISDDKYNMSVPLGNFSADEIWSSTLVSHLPSALS